MAGTPDLYGQPRCPESGQATETAVQGRAIGWTEIIGGRVPLWLRVCRPGDSVLRELVPSVIEEWADEERVVDVDFPTVRGEPRIRLTAEPTTLQLDLGEAA